MKEVVDRGKYRALVNRQGYIDHGNTAEDARHAGREIGATENAGEFHDGKNPAAVGLLREIPDTLPLRSRASALRFADA
jgi:hypothetical protein